MKRLLLIFLILALLTGCGKKQSEVTPSTKSVPSSIHIAYMPNSAVEQDTSGALRVFAVSEGVERLEVLDSGLVLIDNLGKMVVISEENGSVLSSNEGEQVLLFAQPGSVVTYNSKSATVTVLDDHMIQKAQHVLEDGVIGQPIAGSQEVFYCIGDHIRALNLESGLSRNVMQYVPAEQFLTGSYFGGDLIGWNDGENVVYLSSKDGQVVSQGVEMLDFQTGLDNYYGIYLDGTVQQCVWGTLDSDPMQVVLDQELLVYPQMNSNCIVTVKTQEHGLTVARYNMGDGKCAGLLTAKIAGQLLDVAADEKYTWFLTSEGLYSWEYSRNECTDPVSCLTSMITADSPDVAALDACADRAKKISEKYGVDIHVWEAALLNDESYVITAEYQAPTINQMLDSVEQQLSKIPESLLKSTDEYCGVQICLVRSIQGYDFVQYRSESGLCIAVTPNANMEEAILTGLGWGVDSCIIGNSRDLDYWDDLNPAGFEYDYSYFVNEHRTDLEHLEGENKAFVDKRSMSFPSEDRARIFYYAMTDGNQELFKSPTLQAKLKTLCEGIREAYGWQKDTQSFLWEQYLEQSLAYKK